MIWFALIWFFCLAIMILHHLKTIWIYENFGVKFSIRSAVLWAILAGPVEFICAIYFYRFCDKQEFIFHEKYRVDYYNLNLKDSEKEDMFDALFKNYFSFPKFW